MNPIKVSDNINFKIKPDALKKIVIDSVEKIGGIWDIKVNQESVNTLIKGINTDINNSTDITIIKNAEQATTEFQENIKTNLENLLYCLRIFKGYYDESSSWKKGFITKLESSSISTTVAEIDNFLKDIILKLNDDMESIVTTITNNSTLTYKDITIDIDKFLIYISEYIVYVSNANVIQKLNLTRPQQIEMLNEIKNFIEKFMGDFRTTKITMDPNALKYSEQIYPMEIGILRKQMYTGGNNKKSSKHHGKIPRRRFTRVRRRVTHS